MVRKANRRYHDRVAGRYDAVYDGPYWRFYRELSWRHLVRFLPGHRPAWGADLGCGTGHFGVRLLKAGLHVAFVDPSGGMLGRAREAAAAEAHRGLETHFVQAGLEDLSGVGDGAWSFATGQGDPLSFCEDPRRALRELRRVIAPGGTLVLSVDSRIGGVRALLEGGRLDQALELLRTGRTEWLGRRPEERFPMKMFTPDELDDLLGRAGFEPLGRIAKTCLVQRRHEDALEDRQRRRSLIAAEEKVHARPEWFGLASHFQVAARRA